MDNIVVVMAGGLGKRMNSDLPKVLHEVNHKPMLIHVIEKSMLINPIKIIVVVGKFFDLISKCIDKYNLSNIVTYAHQDQPLGTGHAIKCCRNLLLNHTNCNTIILSGDVPLIQGYTIFNMLQNMGYAKILTTDIKDPTGYGRIIEKNDAFFKIVEEKDCDSKQKEISKINGGIYCFNNRILCKYINEIKNDNAQNEFYLTDILEIIKNKEYVQIDQHFLSYEDQYQILGVNTPEQLKQISMKYSNFL